MKGCTLFFPCNFLNIGNGGCFPTAVKCHPCIFGLRRFFSSYGAPPFSAFGWCRLFFRSFLSPLLISKPNDTFRNPPLLSWPFWLDWVSGVSFWGGFRIRRYWFFLGLAWPSPDWAGSWPRP